MDSRMARSDETAFRDAAVDAFRGDRDLERMLSDIGLHRKDWPERHLSPQDAWGHALHVLGDSDVDGGQLALLRRALKDRPRHPVLTELAARYTATPATAGTTTTAGPAPGVMPDREWDFFISYTRADRPWAEWIAWTLEEKGYRVLIQAWDFVGGTNWTNRMQDGVVRSQRMVAVLSEAYLGSLYGTAEWQAMFRRDPLGEHRRLITARIEDCDRPGLINVVGCDLFGIGEQEAGRVLLRCVEGAVRGRLKPRTPPPFPAGRAVPGPVEFPGRRGQG